MTIPINEEVLKFQEELGKISLEKVEQNLRHHMYGSKDNWKYKEAEAFVRLRKESLEVDIKRESINQAQENNRLQEQANRTAR